MSAARNRKVPDMDEFDLLILTDLIGHIYEAAADDRHWNEMVGMLAGFYPHARITLFGHNHKQPELSLKVCGNFDPRDVQAYFEHHATTSPYLARADRVPVGQAVVSEMVVRDDELFRTEHYNEYVRPRGLGHYSTGVMLERSPARTMALSIVEHEDVVDRRARQARLVELLIPHLTRALRLRRTLSAAKAEAEATQAAFDRWSHAALILNAEGGVVSINSSAEQQLRRADGLSLGRDGKLRCIDEARTRQLRLAIGQCAAISSIVDRDKRGADPDGVALPRPSGLAPLRAMMWPLPSAGGGMLDVEPGAVLLVLFDPCRQSDTPVGWMARQYGLTPSEQKLTEAIVNGMTVTEAADHLGIERSTARQRLKTIQSKTDCHRQVDLVRLALSAPPVTAADG